MVTNYFHFGGKVRGTESGHLGWNLSDRQANLARANDLLRRHRDILVTYATARLLHCIENVSGGGCRRPELYADFFT
jgi:hypothetical protein